MSLHLAGSLLVLYIVWCRCGTFMPCISLNTSRVTNHLLLLLLYMLGVMLLALLWHLQGLRIVLVSSNDLLMECKRAASKLDHAPPWPGMQCSTGTGKRGSSHTRR